MFHGTRQFSIGGLDTCTVTKFNESHSSNILKVSSVLVGYLLSLVSFRRNNFWLLKVDYLIA
jgi:uncharacterized YccA/Bax inhibitor family protein